MIKRQELHQQHRADFALRIYPEFRVVNSRPGQAARRTHVCDATFSALKPEAERIDTRTESKWQARQRIRRGLQANPDFTNIVLSHELDGFRLQQLLAVQTAIIQKQADELCVVTRSA